MALVLVDTNILIDYLNGIQAAIDELAVHSDKAISIVSWIEVLAGTPPAVDRSTRDVLAQFMLIDCRQGAVADEALAIRRASLLPGRKKLRLPDVIILATANVHGRVLLTRYTKDFRHIPNVRIPYEI